MGAKDSKPSFISYDDAAKRVSDSELRRIREAFKRCAGVNGTSLSLDSFLHDVLCDGVPTEVAEWLYQACGGTKRGITFKDLLCGIVVLTKGNIDEKIKFLWTLYVNNQSDNGLYIYKWDFARTLHLENTSLPVTNAPKTAEILTSLFGSGDRVTFEQFRSWLLIHKNATVMSKWLLSDLNMNMLQDLETPTFYQSLAGVTHLEERDIIELEKCFWSLRNSAPTGQLDAESVTPLLTPPLPRGAVRGVFLAFDENRDGHVDFKELCCGLSAACRGPRTERLKFCFKIFDLDRDGLLNKRELTDMVTILTQVANEALKNQCMRASTPDGPEPQPEITKTFEPEIILVNLKDKLTNVPKRDKPVFQLGPSTQIIDSDLSNDTSIELPENTSLPQTDSDIWNELAQISIEESQFSSDFSQLNEVIDEDMALTMEDFLIWSVESAEALVTPFLDLIFEVCHIVLGLRPQCKHQERDIVLGWLRRETCRGYRVGQFWYLVGSEWWWGWLAYTAAGDACCRAPPRDDGDSFTSNSTESMGSLLCRADSSSLGSGSSSGVSSARGPPLRRPTPMDNTKLLAPNQFKVRTLTGEGGLLRRDVTLAQHRDFELLPDALWRALAAWYGGPHPLPRQVIRPPNSDVELELYPLQLKILRHVPAPPKPALGPPAGSLCSSAPAPPERQLAYTAAFSRLATVKQVTEFLCSALGLAREDVRLWSVSEGGSVLLDDERWALGALAGAAGALGGAGAGGSAGAGAGAGAGAPALLLEVRSRDLTWPEEIGALRCGSGRERRGTLLAPELAGATGLHNLGNTCFMNAALQAVWNTGPLTRYFNSGLHLYEINTTNPLGTKGALAIRYGELCKEVWSMSARSVAPLRVRWCVSRWARSLASGQHDAQELLAWLLDTLHEDLNRACSEPPAPPPAAPPDPPEGEARPDEAVAEAAWQQFVSRNRSIVSELFYGQLKSRVRCDHCRHHSATFEPFNMLSLPLPVDADLTVTTRVVRQDGSVPLRCAVRVPPDATYRHVKEQLAEICQLPADNMIIVEVSGARISRVFAEWARVRPPPADLAAYELPAGAAPPTPPDNIDSWDSWSSSSKTAGEPGAGAGAGAEVSAGGSSLCMPALFCFKRSASEMGASPPRGQGGLPRCHTLPRGGSSRMEGSPTPSARSLTLAPPAQAPPPAPPLYNDNYIVAVHRKQTRADAYFLPPQRSRPALFGAPLLVGLAGAGGAGGGRLLYARVWQQVARLLSARPDTDLPNHAADCDDSLGYEFPFTLRLVQGAAAQWCAVCEWPRLCRGCPISSVDDSEAPPGEGGRGSRCSLRGAGPGSPAARNKLGHRCSLDTTPEGPKDGSGASEMPPGAPLDLAAVRAACRRTRAALAIDWDPTALHLRYQLQREKAVVEHASVARCQVEAARPVDLQQCLRAFTSEERLEESYHCARCRAPRPASKKMQIWRLPPVLVIHLKRFQFVNNKWMKSQKVVKFPFSEFDPTAYLAAVPQETVLRHQELHQELPPELHRDLHELQRTEDGRRDSAASVSGAKQKLDRKRRASADRSTRRRLESASLAASPVCDDRLVDYQRHHLQPNQDPFDLKYRLYAVVSHSGQLSGGHYVAYARNPSGAWLCYNDSSCRQLPPPPPPPHPPHPPLDPAAAYLLFYERQGLDYEPYLPATEGQEPKVQDPEAFDPDETDLKKMCTIM